MPDKPNDSKFMAMLERRGIVRKTDSEDEQAEAENASERPEPDLRTILGQPEGDEARITPAPRQPVPGIINPVMPSASQQASAAAQPTPPAQPQSPPAAASQPSGQSSDRQSVASPQERQEAAKPAEAATAQRAAAADPQTARIQEPPASGAARTEPAPARPSYSPTPGAATQTSPPAPPAPPAPLAQQGGERTQEPKSETYTDRYLEVDDLYEALAIKSKRTDSIYLVEEYLKTLPDSLPDDSRREIVTKIVAASGFDFDRLMGDGVLRVRMLKEYAESFAQYTENYVNARHAELDELEQQIMRVRTLIEARRELHKRQFFTIEAEAQRLKEILTFISG